MYSYTILRILDFNIDDCIILKGEIYELFLTIKEKKFGPGIEVLKYEKYKYKNN